MTIEAVLTKGTERLKGAQITEAQLDAMYLLQAIFGITKMEYLMERKQEARPEKVQEYESAIERRASHIPLQHLLGTQEFMGYEFVVNKNVLIPRQDTEVLVEEVSKLCQGKSVLDVCTGSGCIILSLEKMCHLTKAVGVDLSDKALEVAKENKKRLGCSTVFLKSDLYEAVEGTYDVIVSNPPYIASDVIPTLMEEVRVHEPHMALDGGADGLRFYRQLVEKAPGYLKVGGYLCFEIGYDQGSAVQELMEQRGFQNCRVIPDLAGLDRVVIGNWQ